MQNKGLVIKNTGSWYIVKTDDKQVVNCKVKGNFRLKGIRSTNPVSVGDVVDIVINSDNTTGFITKIDERKNYIIRRASNLSKESHIIAANLDQAILIVTLRNPETSTTFIDRFLATAEAYRIPTIIVINKVDLLVDEDEREYLNAIKYLYESIGYHVMETSVYDPNSLTPLHELLDGKISLLSGHSGVGKSTLINYLIPNMNLRTAEVSAVHQTGMHTTTFSEMFPVNDSEDGYIIDTPGIKGFGTIDFDKNQVAHYFPEIFNFSHECRYNNCTHTHEPKCAVREALDNHQISQSRYNSYLSILEDEESDRYR
ncbi:MAG: ribosome small subunit-dependent GTPase A [Bacteroidales bacterium]